MTTWLSAAALWSLCVGIVAGQGGPKKFCDFDGFGADPRLAEAIQSTTAYFGCSPGSDCLVWNLVKGDPVLVYKADGDWTCGYHSNDKGEAPMWVRSKDILMLPVDPNPPLSAWQGTWGGENHIKIQASKTSGRLDLEGGAVWHGNNDVQHLGQFAGTSSPKGNHMRVTDDGCTVDLTLIGKYLVTDDNSGCGGVNVHFAGIWQRKQSPRAPLRP